MARSAKPVAFLATAALILLSATPVAAQRTALTGEKARVADAVKRDLSRLATLQRTHRSRTRAFASDPKDLNFTPTSGAEVSIAFASANAWAANASHAALAPMKCFVIVSAADAADAPSSQPFCTDADPNSAAGRVAASGNAPSTTPATDPAPEKVAAPAPNRGSAPPRANTGANRAAANPPAVAPANTPTNTPTNSGAAPRTNRAAAVPPAVTPVNAPAAGAQAAIRMITRDAAQMAVSEPVETVNATEFAAALAAMARDAVATMDAPPPQLVRDPYESTQEFEARRNAAMAEYQAREASWFTNTKRSFTVTVPVRNVRYDADTELLEFAVDPLRLPSRREGRSQLTIACLTRPVFWCQPDAGLAYDANDLWKVPRATARQYDVLRTPMTLTARFVVGGGAAGERALAVSLVDLELHARGEVVQRWAAR